MMSSAIEQENVLRLAPRAGADLRAARERIGWSLPDIATALRIRLQYLEALEAGRIGDLPGNAYALGFLRTYAVALGLDPNEVARRFKAEAAAVNAKTRVGFPRAGAGAGRAGRGGGAARRAPGGRRLCRLVPAVRRGPAAGRDQHTGSGTPRITGRAGRAARQTAAAAVHGRRAGRTAAGAAGRGAAGAGDLAEFGRGGPGHAIAGARRTVRPVAHPAAGERRCLGAGARPRRPGAAEPHPASRRDLGGAGRSRTCC